jgi:flagellar protein FlaJ
MTYADISYQFFGELSKSIRPYFLDIREELKKANLNYTLEEYLSLAIFTTAITFLAETVILAFIFGLFINPLISLVLSFTLSMAVSGLLFFLFYTYPTAASKNRANKIRKVLPFSTSYMATIASSNVQPITVFKTISKFKEYSEMSIEAESIVRDVEMFGMTMSSAIKKQAKLTPSSELKELLFGINTMALSGGNLAVYLKEKSEEYMNDYRRRIRKYSQDLSLYVEMYLTLIITGSIFFIVLSSIIATISAGLGTILIQMLIVFVMLPLISIAFIFLIRAADPT